ncbi:MAG TPA: Gldg family protein, partial [Planctomycetota bacterium]|nr:Gldg family protein [Planctomycetota bacterium]
EGITESSSVRQWNPHVAIPLAIVAAGLLALAALNFGAVVQALSSRRAIVAANVTLMVLFALGIVVVLNLIAARHYRVFDWTTRGLYALTERTERIAASLPRKVTAHVIGPEQHPLFTTVRGTLDMLRAASNGQLEVEYLDPYNDRDRLERELQALGVSQKDLGDPQETLQENPVVIFESPREAGLPRTKHVTFRDLVDADFTGERPRGLKAEEVFTQALLDVTSEKQTAVYFLAGHQELELAGNGSDPDRLSLLERALKQLGFKVDTFELDLRHGSGKEDLPADCDVLAIAGPRERLEDRVIAKIRAFLARGGRLLVLGEPVMGQRIDRSVYFQDLRLDALLKDYGLGFEPARVYDEGTQTPLGDFSLAPAVAGDSARHPITRPLAGSRVIFNVAGPVKVTPPADPASRLSVQAILSTAGGAIAIKDMDALRSPSANPYRVDHIQGPIVLAAVATRPAEAPTPTAAPAGETSTAAAGGRVTTETRIVAVGDASFATDGLAGLSQTNLDFAVNALGWLGAREETIAVASKPPEIIRLRVGEDDDYRIKLLCLVELPLLCAVLGLGVYWMRRS